MLLAFFMISAMTIAGDVVAADDRHFVAEAEIIAISRDDQANAIKTRRIEQPVPLSEVIEALTTWVRVTHDEYLVYAHTMRSVSGTVVIAFDSRWVSYLWEIEPNYAATLVGPGNEKIYLLHPSLMDDDGNPKQPIGS